MARIALVEDDAAISELVRYNLESDGYEVTAHRDGESFLQSLDASGTAAADLVLLDVMLPGIDGFQVLQALRRTPKTSSIPILMLTARGAEADKVRGLEEGADDYLAKPFGIRELLARVHALLRRSGGIPSENARSRFPASASPGVDTSPDRGEVLHGQGEVVLDDARHRVFRKDAEVVLTHREYELLRHLMEHAGFAFSRDDLLRGVWGYDFAGETRTVDVHIRQLRLKLGDTDPSAPIIETVRGRGYRFREN